LRTGSAPGYWMNETGGELRPAVERYLKDAPLTIRDIALIRAYLCQWINASVWDDNPHMGDLGRTELEGLRELARVLTNRAAIDAWIGMAVDSGMDPL
jgi:hypothetical protein